MQPLSQPRPRTQPNQEPAPAAGPSRRGRQAFGRTAGLAALALLAVTGVLSGNRLAALTPAPQPTNAAQHKKAADPSASSRRHAVAHRHSASTQHAATQHNAAPGAAVIAAPPAPKWPAQEPAKEAKVIWDSHGLEIQASNSSLDQILHDAATDIGASVRGLDQDQRIFGTYGPGPAREVLSKLLDGSGYNVLMVGDRGDGAPREIVLSVSSPAGPQTAQSRKSDTEAEEQPEPEPPPSYPAEEPNPSPIQNPFGNGVPARNPQQMMQEMQQRQQQIEQQRQEQQQNNPQ